MEPEYILLITGGGVFVLLLFIYLIYAIEKAKAEHRNRTNMLKSYLPENLQKMEYDVAFYDKNVFQYGGNSREAARQVTIDDLLSDEADNITQMTEEAVFTQVEDKGMEQITGRYGNR